MGMGWDMMLRRSPRRRGGTGEVGLRSSFANAMGSEHVAKPVQNERGQLQFGWDWLLASQWEQR